MPSKKKKYNARFPPARIKKIMQSDEEVGKVAQAVPVIISRALELFVESLLKKAEVVTNIRNAKTLTPSHLKQCILAEHRFDFLKELVATVPDVQGDEELAETPRSSSANTPFTFPPPSSTATSGTVQGEPRRSSVSYINDPNLVAYHVPPPVASAYFQEPHISQPPPTSILNPVGANSNPYIPFHVQQPPGPRTDFQYHVQSNVQMTPPENGFMADSISSLSTDSSSVKSNNASSGVIVYDREPHKSFQEKSSHV